MTLSQRIAALGENQTFVTFMAHAGFSFFVITFAKRHDVSLWAVIPAALLLAAWKEFVWDIQNEHTPPQTVAIGLVDFAGYATGVTLGALLA